MDKASLYIDGNYAGKITSWDVWMADETQAGSLHLKMQHLVRRRKVLVRAVVLAELFSGRTFRAHADLIPEGAGIVSCQYIACRDAFELVVEHKSFDEVENDESMPQTEPMIECLTDFDKMDRVAEAAAVLAGVPYSYGCYRTYRVEYGNSRVTRDWEKLREALVDAGYPIPVNTAT